MKRAGVYLSILTWTSPLLLVLIYVQLTTGLGSIKGAQLRQVTLGLFNPAYAGKIHTVWLPMAVGLMVYLHATLGLQMLVCRAAWIKRKGVVEAGIWLVALLVLLQFLALYLG